MKKKLYKSSTDKKIAGVCAGIANYIGIDPTIVRLVYAVVSLFTSGFPGLALYVALVIALPSDNGMIDTSAENKDDSEK